MSGSVDSGVGTLGLRSATHAACIVHASRVTLAIATVRARRAALAEGVGAAHHSPALAMAEGVRQTDLHARLAQVRRFIVPPFVWSSRTASACLRQAHRICYPPRLRAAGLVR